MKIFENYAHFCAHYSLEVMVCFLTMFVGAVSLNLHFPFEFCQWSFECQSKDDDELPLNASSDAVLLSMLRCSTIIYIFMKARQICQLGSDYLVAGVGICLVFGSLAFSATLVQLLQKDWRIVGEALPVFLLLVDVSRITLLIQHSLTARSYNELQHRIAEAMRVIGPLITFDTVLETLVIITSSTMKVRQLQEILCFACLSVFINFVIFTTFVPACLSIFLMKFEKKLPKGYPAWYNEHFSDVLHKKCSQNTRLKLLSCFMLIIINGWRLLYGGSLLQNQNLQEKFDSFLTLTPQQFFTVIILILLSSKFFMPSDEGERNLPKLSPAPSRDMTPSKIPPEIEETHSLRSLETCLKLLDEDSSLLADEEVMELVLAGMIQKHRLEVVLEDANRGVLIRRKLLISRFENDNQRRAIRNIPHDHYNFSTATAACCENTVGYVPVPVGVAGPLLMNGKNYHVPMATTEGTLLASTNRGMKAISMSGGVDCTVYRDGMTRAPVVEFDTSREAIELAMWLEDSYKFLLLKDKFEETSRYARLQSVITEPSGRRLFIRFNASTGDAMGMNMVSKGVEHALLLVQEHFPRMKIISLSGNVCTDKKPSAINWILGRGKSVIAEARIPSSVVRDILKTDIDSLINLNTSKNLIGSAMAGTVGGFNAHAANAVTAIYIATGQDPAQNVEGSKCMTMLEKVKNHDSHEPCLLITCTMPCIEVATCGGGTALDAQRACLNLLGVAGSSGNVENAVSGVNAKTLAQVVCGTVLASELSLLSALNEGHLVPSHMRHNRLPGEPREVQKLEHGLM